MSPRADVFARRAAASALLALWVASSWPELLRSARDRPTHFALAAAAVAVLDIIESEGLVERAVVLAEEGKIRPAELPPEIRDESALFPSRQFEVPPQGVDFEKVEESLLRQAVERSGGVHTRGAELLRMSYKTYIYRLKKFGIITS